ncbi:MAG TPA: carboxypeptidase-like regulatory domain-containing protein [Terriglobales bacterium]|nr:carboxypeptidase-like regulatory domain-containing protein [Terriglobales bacterium]
MTIRSRISLFFCAVILTSFALYFLPAAAIHAQQTKSANYGLIFGTVWGPDDRPVYGVTVKIRKVGEKKARWEVHSNNLGEFEQRVPAGKQDYVLWADLRGYKNSQYKHLEPGGEVTIHIETDERVDTSVHLK